MIGKYCGLGKLCGLNGVLLFIRLIHNSGKVAHCSDIFMYVCVIIYYLAALTKIDREIVAAKL